MLEHIKDGGGFLRRYSLLIKKKFTSKNQYRPFLFHLGGQHSLHIVFMVANYPVRFFLTDFFLSMRW